MAQDYRFTLASNKAPKLTCPECGKVKHWQRYLDTHTGELLLERYGRCDNADKCGAWNDPHKDGYIKAIWERERGADAGFPKTDYHQRRPQRLHYTVCTHAAPYTFPDEPYFTEIAPYDPTEKGIKGTLTLSGLADRLNTFCNPTGQKDANPAILKGLYHGGTAGEHCTTPAPFLFFDIDVKPEENSALLEPKNNSRVFECLKGIAVLIWRSNSQRGIAGMLHVPQLLTLNNEARETHLEHAKLIYAHLAGIIAEKTGLQVVFDWQQGKFRQIRYLAQQTEVRATNPKPFEFRLCPQTKKPPAFIPGEALTTTLQGYESNTFIQNLLHRVPFPLAAADVSKVTGLYYLGTISEGYMSGAVTFPFIDISGNIRAAQAKTFDAANHTTGTSSLPYILEQQHTKAGTPLPDWLKAYKESGNGFSCLFGEHLLSRYPHHTIALVEAPKTAIYGALYFGLPEDSNLIWLAVYNKSAFTFGRLQALRGRNVIIFPDLSKDGSTFAEWSAKAADFEKRMPGTLFTVSELLEESAGAADRAAGNDLADVLITQDWRGYRNPPPTPPAPTVPETPTPQPPANPLPVAENLTKPDVLEPGTLNLQDAPLLGQTSPFLPEARQIPSDSEKADTHTLQAFTDDWGRLFIETPTAQTFTVWPSIGHYNRREGIPEFIPRHEVAAATMQPVRVALQTLTVGASAFL